MSDLNIGQKDNKNSWCSLFHFRKKKTNKSILFNLFNIILCVVFPKLTDILTLFKFKASLYKLQNGLRAPEVLRIKIVWFT